MAAYRYWRLFSKARSVGSVSFAEVALHTSPGGSAETISSVSASSVFSSPTWDAANAVDGNSATAWNSLNQGAESNHWLRFDLGSAKDIVEIVAKGRADASSTDGRPVWIEASNDDTTWVLVSPMYSMVQNPSGTENAAGGTYTFAVDQTQVIVNIAVAPGGYVGFSTGPFEGAKGSLMEAKNLRPGITGGGVIEGTVAKDDSPDIPVRRRVRLYRAVDGTKVAETWSDAITGAYSFSDLKIQPYFVVAHDYENFYNAVIKDQITPEIA